MSRPNTSKSGRSKRSRDLALRPVAELQPHPSAELVPSLSASEVEALAADIRDRGVLKPLDVTAAGVVLDGHERLRVAHIVGLEQLPVRVVEAADERRYILLEALRRKHLNPGQRALIGLELWGGERVRLEAQARQRANLKQYAEVATLPPRGEKTRDHIAKRLGVSARTVQDADTVRRSDDELCAEVLAGTTPVSKAAQTVRRRRRYGACGPPPPLPPGKFELIYADPPWQLGSPDSAKAPENHYPTMPLEEILALRPPAADDAVLYLWAVNMLLPEALRVIINWGFSYVTNLVWVKPSIGLGGWARNRHELLLVGRRGRHPAPDAEDRPDSVIQAARRRHSQKPECVYELLERAHPQARKLELFARTQRPGWTAWGDEAP